MFISEKQIAFINKDSYERELNVSDSEKAILRCEVSDSKTEVKQYEDGKQLSLRKNFDMEAKSNNHQLMLDYVDKRDAGQYTCEAEKETLLNKVQPTGTANLIC